MQPDSPAARRRSVWLRRLGISILVTYFVLGAVFLVIRDLVWSDLDRWRPQIEQILTRYTGHPVQILGLSGGFYGFSPSVNADSIRIVRADGRELFSATQVSAGLNWRTFIRWVPTFDVLTSRKLTMRIDRSSDNQVQIAGRSFDLSRMTGLSPVSRIDGNNGRPRWHLPDWLMAHQGFRLDQVDIDYYDIQTGAALAVIGMSIQSHERDGQRSLLIDVPRFSDQNGSVQFKATLGRSDKGGALALPQWHGNAWIKVTDFDSSRVARLIRQPFLLQRGEFSAQAWFTLARSVPADARLIVQATDVLLQAEQNEAEFQSVGAQVDAMWTDDGNMQLTVSKAQITDRTGSQITVDDSSQSATFNTALEPVQARLSLQAFDARRFHRFAMGLPIPGDLRARFARLSLDGRVASLQLDYDARNGPTRYNIDARFDRLSIGSDLNKKQMVPTRWSPGLPSAENISGEVTINETQGSARLHGANSAITFPGVFAKPRIELDSLHADLSWRIKPERLPVNSDGHARLDVIVRIERLAFSNADSEGVVSGTYRTAPSGPGQINLEGRLHRADASQVHRYMPLKILGTVRTWMQESFVAGRSDDVRLVLRGDLKDFPFRKKGSGEFIVDARVKDATFRYAPRWPAIEGMQARVTIHRGGLEVVSNQAQIYDVALQRTSARIADFRNAILQVKGDATGSAQQMVRYVNESPIGPRINAFTAKTRISGIAKTELELNLPLKNFDEFKVSGSTTVNNVSLKLTDFLPAISNVVGELQFSEKGIAIEKMTGFLLGGRSSVTAKSPKRGLTEIKLDGTVSSTGIHTVYDNVLTRSIEGATRYVATIRIDRGLPSITVRSALKGMRVDLPPPMYKRAEVLLPMTVRFQPLDTTADGPRSDQLIVSIPEDRFEAVLRRKRNDKGQMRIASGVLSIGDDGRPILPDSGLKVAVTGVPVNADRWIEFWSADQRVRKTPAIELTKSSSEPAQRRVADDGYFAGFDLVPSNITLVAPSARFLNKRFHDVVLGVSRIGRRWKANFSTREANGYVSYFDQVRTTDAALLARFSRLEIPQSEVTSFERLLVDSQLDLPSMDIRAEQFIVHQRPLGRLRLRAANRRGHWLINELSLEQPSARFAASGRWSPLPGSSRRATQLNFDLDVNDSGLLLVAMGMPDTLREGPGKLSGQLRWEGSPFALDLPSLGGDISIALGRGQFLKTEPGIAKLIGVLSLQALPRRLSLDFSDVFENGFAFDAIVGKASIKQGVAKTESLLMHGIQAEVLIDGTADIAGETQELSVKVAPHINAGIASLAYAALANPAIGLGTLLAQIILDKPLKEIFGHEFRVTGSWDAPMVTGVNRFEQEETDPSASHTPG